MTKDKDCESVDLDVVSFEELGRTPTPFEGKRLDSGADGLWTQPQLNRRCKSAHRELLENQFPPEQS